MSEWVLVQYRASRKIDLANFEFYPDDDQSKKIEIKSAFLEEILKC